MSRPISILAILFVICIAFVLLLTASNSTQAQVNIDFSDYRETMIRMVGTAADNRFFQSNDSGIFSAVGDTGDPLYIAPLIDVLYFSRDQESVTTIQDALQRLTGETGDWRTYTEWAGSNNIEVPPDYDEFKGLLFSVFVDPEFSRFFEPGVQETAQVNLSEAVWGGVRVDGIPSLVNARQITPEEAILEGETLSQFCREDDCSYPATDELVFGVSINGDNRAYPLRLLNWHEMFNDVIGHTPLLDAPNGESMCNFRAPTPFRAVQRAGDEFVYIIGESAGCPESGGWVSLADVVWTSGTDAYQALPDLDANEQQLNETEGIAGQVNGKPVMLAYCTLCGAGVLYDVTIPDLSYTSLEGKVVDAGETVLEFGSTGMLMRSNKLMYDRNTDTVWNAITGEPAFGPLVSADIVLDLLPVVVTDWASWLEEHPDTSVLSLDTGFRRDYTNGGAYGDYFNDPNFIMFPVWQQDTTEQENKEVVFAIKFDNQAKAYPLETIVDEAVTNDTHAGTDLVLISQASPERDFFEPGGAAVRAYERGDLEFSATDNPNEVSDSDDNIWQVTEDALVNANGDTLARLPGHLAFWFGWYSFYPDTEVYVG